jgi:hypothetical protein
MKTLLTLLLLAISLCQCSELAVESKTFQVTRVSFGTAQATTQSYLAWIFTIQFNSSLYIGSSNLADLSVVFKDPLLAADNYPTAVTQQYGTTRLICPCSDCNTTTYSQCDGTDCIYESINIPDHYSDFALPVPPFKDETVGAYSVLTNVDTGYDETVDGKFVLVKTVEYYDTTADPPAWTTIVPPEVDPSTCIIEFQTLAQSSVTSKYFSSTTGASALAQNVTDFVEVTDIPCNYTQLLEDLVLYEAALDDLLLTSVNAIDELEDKQIAVQILQARANTKACGDLAGSLLNREDVEHVLLQDKYCHYDEGSDEWDADPCCNPAITDTCCAPRDLTVTYESFTTPKTSEVNAACDDDTESANALKMYAALSRYRDRCNNQTKGQGVAINGENSGEFSFIDTCITKAYTAVQSNTQYCTSDSECLTRCGFNGKCVIPFTSPETYLVACLAEKMTPEYAVYLRQSLDLEADASDTDVATALSSGFRSNNCGGPTSASSEFRITYTHPGSCTNGDPNCLCVKDYSESKRSVSRKTQQQHHIPHRSSRKKASHRKKNHMETHEDDDYQEILMISRSISQSQVCTLKTNVAGNQTACGIDYACYKTIGTSSSTGISSMDCSSLASDFQPFCGECYGNVCDPITERGYCYSWHNNITGDCTGIGGAVDSTGAKCIYANIVSVATCINQTICPAFDETAAANWATRDFTCNGFCYYNAITTSGACTAKTANGIISVWDTNVASGNGVCKLSNIPSKGLCNSLAGGDASITWWAGKNWHSNRFNSSTTCGHGRCSGIHGLRDGAQCAGNYACDKPCTSCKSNTPRPTLCFTTGLTSTQCTTVSGVHDAVNSLCRFVHINDETHCLFAGYTWQACADLTIDECQQCSYNASSPTCSIRQEVLKCYPEYNDICASNATCMASGECSDWEIFNPSITGSGWSCNVYADRIAHQDDCYKACIIPPTVDPLSGVLSCGSQTVTKLGCLGTATTSTACTAAGGVWTSKARTEDDCVAQGHVCYEPTKPYPYSNKTEAECDACGGTYQSAYTWTAGTWVHGTAVTTNISWKSSSLHALNTWTSLMNRTSVHNMLVDTRVDMEKNKYLNQLSCNNAFSDAISNRIACACGSEKGTDCFADITYSEIIRVDVIKGLELSHQWGNVMINTSDTSTNETGIVTISGSLLIDLLTLIGQLKINSLTSAARAEDGQEAYDRTAKYFVVTNTHDAVVGQVLGQGILVNNVTGDFPNITLCIAMDEEIFPDRGDFPQPDLGVLVNTSGVLTIEPLGLDNATLEADQICGIVIANGTYFPIFRYENYTDVLPPPPVTNPPHAPLGTPATVIMAVLMSVGGVFGAGAVGLAVYSYNNSPSGFSSASSRRKSHHYDYVREDPYDSSKSS